MTELVCCDSYNGLRHGPSAVVRMKTKYHCITIFPRDRKDAIKFSTVILLNYTYCRAVLDGGVTTATRAPLSLAQMNRQKKNKRRDEKFDTESCIFCAPLPKPLNFS